LTDQEVLTMEICGEYFKFEFYQMSSKKQPGFEKLGGCLSHPRLLSTRLPRQCTWRPVPSTT
jgi:hypothetical protein